MPDLRGMPPQSGGYSPSGYYSAARSSVSPSSSSSGAGGAAGQSPSPYDYGKSDISLFDSTPPSGGIGLPTAPDYTLPNQDQPGAEAIWNAKGISGIPGENFLGGAVDWLAGKLGSQQPVVANDLATHIYDRLRTTPDSQLEPWEVGFKQANINALTGTPDSPIMQGKQIADLFTAWQEAFAHSKGESLLNPVAGYTMSPLDVIGNAYQTAQLGLKRVEGSLPFNDQLQAIKDGNAETLGPERFAIKQQLASGAMNENEARDAIARSSFSLSNPNPIKLPDWLGPSDTIINAALAVGGEFISDPGQLAAAAMSMGTSVGATAVEETITSIVRSIAAHTVEGGAEAAAGGAVSAATDAAFKAAIDGATNAATEAARVPMAKAAMLRQLPKEATIAAKQLGAVAAEHVTSADRLQALLDMGADTSHPWSEAIKQGIKDAGIKGQVATQLPQIARLGEGIQKITDPFSLFGYARTGRTVAMVGNRAAAHGFFDAIGWRVVRRLDKAYTDAGVNPELVDNARRIQVANHMVQVGDAANTHRMVTINSIVQDAMDPTERAVATAERRGDIRSLMKDQVGRTLEYIVPALPGKKGKAEALAQWRERAANYLMDFGATRENALATAGRLDERAMRGLFNDHQGLMIDALDQAKREAIGAPTASWPTQAIGRITFMAPRQMAQQDARRILAQIADGNVQAVRDAVRRYADLNQHISESLSDEAIMAQAKHVIGQIDDALPVAIENMSDMPASLKNFVTDHPGYQLMLRPDDNNLLVGVRNEAGTLTGVKSWVDFVTDRTPSVEVGRLKAAREGLFRGIAGGELERAAGRRFAANMATSVGLSERESANLLRSIRSVARLSQTTPRGLDAGQIYAAADMAVGLSAGTKRVVSSRQTIDALLDAYENELALSGVLPKLTGWVKSSAAQVPGGGGVRWVSDFLYPLARFRRSPLFFAQEVPETPFFLAMQGRYPLSSLVPDIVAEAMGPLGRGIRASKENLRIWNDKTLVVMDRMTRMSANAESDMYEANEMVRMGLISAADITDERTPIGRLLARSEGVFDLQARKAKSVALATRYEYGEMWKRSLQKNMPEQWLAVRAYYPKSMSDNEMAIQWLLDLQARANPDAIYSVMSPAAFRPSHIGARAEISSNLIRYFVYGDDMAQHSWAGLTREIKEGTVSIDQVRRDLMNHGADPDYVERAVHQLTFGTPDEFYRAAAETGVPREQVDAWRLVNKEAATRQDITEAEYLARNFVGRPLEVNQMGNVVGHTLYDDIVESMRVRGRSIPESDSAEVSALKSAAHDRITDVFPIEPPAKMPKGTLPDVRKAANKVRGWVRARSEREADPSIGAPPMVTRPSGAIEPLYQTELHTIGVTTPEQYRRQIVTMMDPEAMAKRGMRAMTEDDARLAVDWYDHIRRAMFALVDEDVAPEDRIQQAAQMLISFGTTQLNTSPADGFRHVFKAYGMKARGETLQLGEAANILQQAVGLNPQQLQKLVWGEGNKIDQKGIAQKLFDFIDSLTGSDRRTNGIAGPKGDWGPVAVDIHTKRDFGFLDPAMGDWVYRLVEKDTPEGLVHGVSSSYAKGSGFTVKMSDGTTEVIPETHIGTGVPTDHEYDYGVELANNIRDHFNDTNFMGRKWSSYEVQALGWYRMQLLKSSEGDAGEVANAVFEQSRWMGSQDLVPSPDAPLNDLYPWHEGVVAPQYQRAIQTEAARHASDEAEMLTGARSITKMDAAAVVNGTYRPSQTVELATDPTGAEQYLAHYLYLSEQDGGVLMRDYTGKTKTPNYAKGVGVSVDIPVRDAEHAQELLHALAGEAGSPLQAIGPHTFVARAIDGSLHLRTLWEPTGASDRNAFNRALRASGLVDRLEQESPGTVAHDTLVDFVSLKNDWKTRPDGGGYMDVIERGSGKHGVMRTPGQRADLVSQYDRAYEKAQRQLRTATRKGDENTIKAATKAVAVAKKEREVARAAPAGRPSAEVRQLVGAARVRVRSTVDAGFNKYASREVRNARERVLGEARDAAGDTLGTDPRWDDVLDRARGSNGEPLYERAPGGTIRAAITRADAGARRSQLYFNRRAVGPRSLVHELIHKEAGNYDDSANRTIAGIFNGLEGTPYGTWTPGTPLTEAQHEWLVNQYMLWRKASDSVHPIMEPLLKHLDNAMLGERTLRAQAVAPSREAIKQIDSDILAAQARRATLKTPAAIAKADAKIATLRTQRVEAQSAAKALRATGGLSPDVQRLLDDLAKKSGERSSVRASTFNADEQQMLEWAQSSAQAAQHRANDIVHMRGERSLVERSINHPFLGVYPSSYMWGKVLPHLAEFLLFRPFGLRHPLGMLTMGNHMNQSFQRQQQYDPELRAFLAKNEPFLRTLSIFVPGLPWDMPVAAPYWMRKVIDTWAENGARRIRGEKEVPLNPLAIAESTAAYQLALRGPDKWGPIVKGLENAPAAFGSILTGQAPTPTGAGFVGDQSQQQAPPESVYPQQ